MIDIETVTRIRQLHHAERWPVGTIAAHLGLHHETVERALSEEPPAEPVLRPSGLDPYAAFMREVLTKYPRLTATRLWRMLRERGCPLSARQVRRKVAELRPTPRESFLRRRTFAGEDYVQRGVMLSAPRCCRCRAIYRRPAPSQDFT